MSNENLPHIRYFKPNVYTAEREKIKKKNVEKLFIVCSASATVMITVMIKLDMLKSLSSLKVNGSSTRNICSD
jgi:hypothetical protein